MTVVGKDRFRVEGTAPDRRVAPPLPRDSTGPVAPPLPEGLDGPLSEADFAAVRQGAARRRALTAAARTARTSGTITLVIGVSALLFSAVGVSAKGLLVGAAVSAVGAVELIGAGRIRRAQPHSAGMLGFNQLAFLAIILAYCLVQMLTFSTQEAREAMLSAEFRAQLGALPSMAESIDRQIDLWAPIAVYGFYGLVALLSLLCQGGMSLYYFTRSGRIEAYNRRTPAWVRRLLAEAGA